jgi:DNA-binding Lrp family transcriptional regulator
MLNAGTKLETSVVNLPTLDSIDARILADLEAHPRATVVSLAQRLGLARNTVHTHLDRLMTVGAITPAGRRTALTAFGFDVMAFITVEIAPGAIDQVAGHLSRIPEVLEAHATTGDGDILCRVIARTAEHLYEVVDRVVSCEGVTRTRTSLAMRELLPYRLEPVLLTL